MSKIGLVIFGISMCCTSCVSVTSLKALSSGSIGCPESEIEITNNRTDVGTLQETWVASCRGHTFHCNTVKGKVFCTKELQPK